MTVRQATILDLDVLVPLFDAYRQFYRQRPDPELARRFLRERLENGQSVIFLASSPDGSAAGFTQLYPSFSSASAAGAVRLTLSTEVTNESAGAV